jgi:hypothetical protein
MEISMKRIFLRLGMAKGKFSWFDGNIYEGDFVKERTGKRFCR